MPSLAEAFHQVSAFGTGMWRYWRFGQPAPESNHIVQKLYAYTDGRSNDFLLRLLESKRKQKDLSLGWDESTVNESAIVPQAGILNPSVEEVARTLNTDGVVVIPFRLKKQAADSLRDLAVSCQLDTVTFGPLAAGQEPGTQSTIPVAATGISKGFDPSQPRHSVYTVPRSLLLENRYLQSLLCDPYLLAVATRYLGVCPVVTKPDMWWDTDFLPPGLRPRPFHTDSGCLRWLKVGINLTDTTLDSPHFVYVRGSHRPNKNTRPLTRLLANRMNLSDKEVNAVCPDRIVHVTAPAGSITLADTRGIHKGELSQSGHRLILYFGLEGSAFNSIDKPIPVNSVGNDLARAMHDRPFSYQFFQAGE